MLRQVAKGVLVHQSESYSKTTPLSWKADPV